MACAIDITVTKKNEFHTCTTFKRIAVGQVWSGIEFATKPDQPGLSSLIRLEVIKDKRKILVRSYTEIFQL